MTPVHRRDKFGFISLMAAFILEAFLYTLWLYIHFTDTEYFLLNFDILLEQFSDYSLYSKASSFSGIQNSVSSVIKKKHKFSFFDVQVKSATSFIFLSHSTSSRLMDLDV